MTLAAVLSAVLLLVALRPDNVLAHEEGQRDGHGCIEDSEHLSTGPHMLYIGSVHEHVDVYNVSGVSNILVTQIANQFDYLGHDVVVRDEETVFMITYTVTRLPGVLELCWDDMIGLWYPIDMSDGSQNNDDDNTNTDTSTTTEDIGTDTDTSTTTEDIGTNTDTDNNPEDLTNPRPNIPVQTSNRDPSPKEAATPTRTPTPTATVKPKGTQESTTKSSTSRKSRRAPFDFDTPTPAPTATAIPVVARMAGSAPTATPTPTRPRAQTSPAPTATPVPTAVPPTAVPVANLAPEPTVFPSPTPTRTPGPTATPTRIPIPIYDATPTLTPRPAGSETVTFARTSPPTATPTRQASDVPGGPESPVVEDTQERDEGGIVEEVRKRGTLIADLASAAVMSGGIAAFLVWRRRLFS